MSNLRKFHYLIRIRESRCLSGGTQLPAGWNWRK